MIKLIFLIIPNFLFYFRSQESLFFRVRIRSNLGIHHSHLCICRPANLRQGVRGDLLQGEAGWGGGGRGRRRRGLTVSCSILLQVSMSSFQPVPDPNTLCRIGFSRPYPHPTFRLSQLNTEQNRKFRTSVIQRSSIWIEKSCCYSRKPVLCLFLLSLFDPPHLYIVLVYKKLHFFKVSACFFKSVKTSRVVPAIWN